MKLPHSYSIREAHNSEFKEIGKLLVEVYSQLDGFPSQEEQPQYYDKLANVGELTNQPKVRLLVAISEEGKIGGAVVYFGEMQYYGSGGSAPNEKNACGFRLLAVSKSARGYGLGSLLTDACIEIGKTENHEQMIIHTTNAMQVAWSMYEKKGFIRSEDLDFSQSGFPVFGFRLKLKDSLG